MRERVKKRSRRQEPQNEDTIRVIRVSPPGPMCDE